MVGWDLGDTVRAARIKQQLTQEELGRRVGVSKDGISRFERGQASLSLEHGARLAQVLGLQVQAFLHRLADARGERALLGQMLSETEPPDERSDLKPEVDTAEYVRTGNEGVPPFHAADGLLPAATQRMERARRRSGGAIERHVDLRDLRVTVRLSLAQPASLEIHIAPASES